MAILRSRYMTHSFTNISNRVLNDSRLSWKARGLLVHLLSKPGNWKVIPSRMEKDSPQGISAIRSGLKELEKYGYAKLITIKGVDGKIIGREWVISDVPTRGDETSDETASMISDVLGPDYGFPRR